jgi:hypothetical protein
VSHLVTSNEGMLQSRGSIGLSDSLVKANRDDLVAGSSAPDDPTHCRCIASEQLCQRISIVM